MLDIRAIDAWIRDFEDGLSRVDITVHGKRLNPQNMELHYQLQVGDVIINAYFNSEVLAEPGSAKAMRAVLMRNITTSWGIGFNARWMEWYESKEILN